MRILNWAHEERPSTLSGNFEITWELYSGEIVRAEVRGVDCEAKIFTSYLVHVNEAEAKLLGLKPGYNLMVQGVNYEST